MPPSPALTCQRQDGKVEQAYCSVSTCEIPGAPKHGGQPAEPQTPVRPSGTTAKFIWMRNQCLTPPSACPETTVVCVSPWIACSLPGSKISNSPWAESSRLSVTSFHFHSSLVSKEGGASFSAVNHSSCVSAYQVYGHLITICKAKKEWRL